MKMRLLLILGLLAYGSAQAAEGDLSPETKCKKALGLLGSAKPIKLILPFASWGNVHAGILTTNSTGLVEILNRSFNDPDPEAGVGDCTVAGDNWVILKVFVKPSLPEIGSTELLQFPHEVKIKFDRDTQGNPVTIKTTDTNRDGDCRDLLEPLLTRYFNDPTKGKSAAFVSNWPDDKNPFKETVSSYCVSFVERFDQVIYNQFK